jgi:hypothetical protein
MFNRVYLLSAFLGVLLLGVAVGLRQAAADEKKDADKQKEAEAEIKANLAKLPEKDRKIAEEQKLCPVTDERLGDPEMGVPIKIMVKDQPVFLCCKGCQKKALADPDKTLAKVKELKDKAKKEEKK